MFTEKEKSTFSYWFAHWCAFNMTALNLKAWKFKYLFHDWEKPWFKLFLPYNKVKELHRTYNRHHPEWLERQLFGMPTGYDWLVEKLLDKFDYEGAVIDWECGRFTKDDTPLNAIEEYQQLFSYENFKKKYPYITRFCYNEFSKKMFEAIKKLGLYE